MDFRSTLKSIALLACLCLIFFSSTLHSHGVWTTGRGIHPGRLRCMGFNLESRAAKSFITGPVMMRAQQESHRVGIIRIEFQPDQDDSTTGNGLFGNLPFYHPHPDTILARQGYVVRDSTINSRSKFYYSKHIQWMREYFEATSRGLFTISDLDTVTDITPIIQLSEKMGVYGDNEDFTGNMLRFVNDSVRSADTLTTFDFARYDALLIFHAGAGEESDFGPPEEFYPGDSPRDLHSAYIPFEALREYLGEGDPDYMGIPTTSEAGETTYVRNALVVPETLIQDSVYNPSAVYLDILGVVVHEYGHHLGLPDLYDPAHPTRPAIGNFGLMGTGAYNSSARLPSEPIGWSKYYLGWVDATEVMSDTNGIELMASEGAGEKAKLIKVPISSSEYYLLENRVRDRDFNGEFEFYDVDGDNWPDLMTDGYRLPDGTFSEFDFALPGIITYPDNPKPGSGVLIWHIDNEVIRGAFDPQFNQNCINCNISRQGVDLEEADGIQHLDELYPATIDPGYGSPFDSYGGEVSGVKQALYGNLNTLFGPSTNPSSTSNLGMATNISISGFRSLTIDPSRSLVDTIVGVDISFEEKLLGFPVVLREEDQMDFEKDPGLFNGNSMALADLDNDGASEIVVVTREGDVFIIDSRGRTFPEGSADISPYISIGKTVSSSPSLGDLDGSEMHDIEIAVLTEDGDLYALLSGGPSGQDVIAQGFPVKLEGSDHRGPLCFDLDGNGTDEIITTSQAGGQLKVSVTGGDGLSQDAWPITIDEESIAIPAIYPHIISGVRADSADIILVTTDGTVYRISGRGEVLWHVSLDETVEVPPVLADLDRDGDIDGDNIAELRGDLEIVVGTVDGDVYVISSDGELLPGGPQSTGGRIRSPLAAADVNMDGYVEIVTLIEDSWDLNIYRLNDTGNALMKLRQFPKHIPVQDVSGSKPYFSSPVTADIDGAIAADQGRFSGEEILFGTKDNKLLVFDVSEATSPIKSYPLGGDLVASAAVGDVDDDGLIDILASDDRGYIYGWKTEMNASQSRSSWSQLGSDFTRKYANVDSLLLAIPSEPPVFTQDSLYVYPNPFIPSKHSKVNIHFEVDRQFMEAKTYIFDISGRRIKEIELFDNSVKEPGDFNPNFRIDDLSSGVYILALELNMVEGNKKHLYKKFAIVK